MKKERTTAAMESTKESIATPFPRDSGEGTKPLPGVPGRGATGDSSKEDDITKRVVVTKIVKKSARGPRLVVTEERVTANDAGVSEVTDSGKMVGIEGETRERFHSGIAGLDQRVNSAVWLTNGEMIVTVIDPEGEVTDSEVNGPGNEVRTREGSRSEIAGFDQGVKPAAGVINGETIEAAFDSGDGASGSEVNGHESIDTEVAGVEPMAEEAGGGTESGTMAGEPLDIVEDGGMMCFMDSTIIFTPGKDVKKGQSVVYHIPRYTNSLEVNMAMLGADGAPYPLPQTDTPALTWEGATGADLEPASASDSWMGQQERPDSAADTLTQEVTFAPAKVAVPLELEAAPTEFTTPLDMDVTTANVDNEANSLPEETDTTTMDMYNTADTFPVKNLETQGTKGDADAVHLGEEQRTDSGVDTETQAPSDDERRNDVVLMGIKGHRAKTAAVAAAENGSEAAENPEEGEDDAAVDQEMKAVIEGATAEETFDGDEFRRSPPPPPGRPDRAAPPGRTARTTPAGQPPGPGPTGRPTGRQTDRRGADGTPMDEDDEEMDSEDETQSSLGSESERSSPEDESETSSSEPAEERRRRKAREIEVTDVRVASYAARVGISGTYIMATEVDGRWTVDHTSRRPGKGMASFVARRILEFQRGRIRVVLRADAANRYAYDVTTRLTAIKGQGGVRVMEVHQHNPDRNASNEWSRMEKAAWQVTLKVTEAFERAGLNSGLAAAQLEAILNKDKDALQTAARASTDELTRIHHSQDRSYQRTAEALTFFQSTLPDPEKGETVRSRWVPPQLTESREKVLGTSRWCEWIRSKVRRELLSAVAEARDMGPAGRYVMGRKNSKSIDPAGWFGRMREELQRMEDSRREAWSARSGAAGGFTGTPAAAAGRKSFNKAAAAGDRDSGRRKAGGKSRSPPRSRRSSPEPRRSPSEARHAQSGRTSAAGRRTPEERLAGEAHRRRSEDERRSPAEAAAVREHFEKRPSKAAREARARAAEAAAEAAAAALAEDTERLSARARLWPPREAPVPPSRGGFRKRKGSPRQGTSGGAGPNPRTNIITTTQQMAAVAAAQAKQEMEAAKKARQKEPRRLQTLLSGVGYFTGERRVVDGGVDTIDELVRNVEHQARKAEWDHHRRIMALSEAMSGAARRWWTENIGEIDNNNWTKTVEVLKKRFPAQEREAVDKVRAIWRPPTWGNLVLQEGPNGRYKHVLQPETKKEIARLAAQPAVMAAQPAVMAARPMIQLRPTTDRGNTGLVRNFLIDSGCPWTVLSPATADMLAKEGAIVGHTPAADNLPENRDLLFVEVEVPYQPCKSIVLRAVYGTDGCQDAIGHADISSYGIEYRPGRRMIHIERLGITAAAKMQEPQDLC